MLNRKLLADVIQQSGMKKSYIAQRLGLSRQTLRACLAGRSEFRVSHINTLCDLLQIEPEQREAIFFAQDGAL